MVKRSRSPEKNRYPNDGIEFAAKVRCIQKTSQSGSYGYWYVSVPKLIVDKYGLLPDDGIEITVNREGLPYPVKEFYHTAMAGGTMVIGLNSAWRRCHARDDDALKKLAGLRNWPIDTIFGVREGDVVNVLIKGKKNVLSNLCTWSYYIEHFEKVTGERLERIVPSMDLVDGHWVPKSI